MNVKLLRKVKRYILAEPRRFIMCIVDIHGAPGTPTGYGSKFARCGTAACIAGWTCALSKVPWEHAYMDRAAEILGISEEESQRLFDPADWPERFEKGATDDGKAKTAKIAAARIEHFIKTKGRE